MKLIEEKDLPFLPYNYTGLLEMDIPEETTQETIQTAGPSKENMFVPVKDFMTPEHFLNLYYFKPIAKYFKEDDFQR